MRAGLITSTQLALVASASLLALAPSAAAQTGASVRSTKQAYGARLNQPSDPESANTRRIDTRVDSRINNRLSLRIERYRVGATSDPTATYRAPVDDGSRRGTATSPVPLQPLPTPPPSFDLSDQPER